MNLKLGTRNINQIRVRSVRIIVGPKKEQPPTNELTLLGAQVRILADAVEVSLAEKKKELIADLAHVLQVRKLTPAGAAKFRGRLGFAQSCLYGKYGRAHLAPFTGRQYDRAKKSGYYLDVALFEVIPRWIRTLSADLPRRVTCNFAHPVLLYTDACGEGHMGVNLVIEDKVIIAHCHAPRWTWSFGIAELEIMATISGMTVAAVYAPGRNVLLRCDNLGAMGVLTRGRSKTSNGRSLASVFWSIAAGAEVHVWIEFAASKANRGDPPSRVCGRLGGRSCKIPMVNVGVPNSFYKLFETKESFHEARFGVRTLERGVRVGWNCQGM